MSSLPDDFAESLQKLPGELSSRNSLVRPETLLQPYHPQTARSARPGASGQGGTRGAAGIIPYLQGRPNYRLGSSPVLPQGKWLPRSSSTDQAYQSQSTSSAHVNPVVGRANDNEDSIDPQLRDQRSPKGNQHHHIVKQPLPDEATPLAQSTLLSPWGDTHQSQPPSAAYLDPTSLVPSPHYQYGSGVEPSIPSRGQTYLPNTADHYFPGHHDAAQPDNAGVQFVPHNQTDPAKRLKEKDDPQDTQRKKEIGRKNGACIECKRRKKQCDGEEPCQRCRQRQLTCTRPSVDHRKRQPPARNIGEAALSVDVNQVPVVASGIPNVPRVGVVSPPEGSMSTIPRTELRSPVVVGVHTYSSVGKNSESALLWRHSEFTIDHTSRREEADSPMSSYAPPSALASSPRQPYHHGHHRQSQQATTATSLDKSSNGGRWDFSSSWQTVASENTEEHSQFEEGMADRMSE